MLAKKAGLFTALAAVMLMLGGCGNNAGANLGGVRNGYEYGRGNAYWDGYGINSGRSLDGYNGATPYGMRNDSLGQDLENAWDDFTGQEEKRTEDRNGKKDKKEKQTEKKEIGNTNKAVN